MEPEAKYTLVGAAVLILAGLVAAAVVWLRSSGEGADALHYKIYFERQSLEGLELRSYVTMRGIRVGSVTGFRFSSMRPGAVEVFTSVDPAAPVRQNTQATVERHLVTGLASVRLMNPSEDSPLLAPTTGPPVGLAWVFRLPGLRRLWPIAKGPSYIPARTFAIALLVHATILAITSAGGLVALAVLGVGRRSQPEESAISPP